MNVLTQVLKNVWSVCGAVLTQIAVMTALLIHLNGNYPSKHTHTLYPSGPCRCAGITRDDRLVWCSGSVPSIVSVSQPVECQLIRLLSSRVGSSFSALRRSGSTQHCICFTPNFGWSTGVAIRPWKLVLEEEARYFILVRASPSAET